MKFGKKQLVMAALVVALGAAVYLHWQLTDNDIIFPTSAVSDATKEKELGKAEFVNSTTDGQNSDEDAQADENADDTIGGQSDSTAFFATAKTERQKAQDEMTELAKGILESAEDSDAAKIEAVAQAAQIATNIERQSNIESLLKAKGFTECLAFINDTECTVTVMESELDEDMVIVIKDIVNSQAGIDFANIKITEV